MTVPVHIAGAAVCGDFAFTLATAAFDFGTGADRICVALVSVDRAVAGASGVTAGGIAMTLDATETDATYGDYQLWTLLAADGLPTGSNIVEATFASNGQKAHLIADVWDDVDQTTPLTGLGNAGTSNGSPFVAIANALGDLAVGMFTRLGAGTTFTPGAGQTTLEEAATGTRRVWSVDGPATTELVNPASQASGGVASASSEYASGSIFGLTAQAANNGLRVASPDGINVDFWNDDTSGIYPDTLDITFTGTATIDTIVVYTIRDDYLGDRSEVDDVETFTLYGLQDFTVATWNGSTWDVRGTATANTLVKRTFTFSPVATTKIRISITDTVDGYSRVAEMEAYGTDMESIASPGGTLSASDQWWGYGFFLVGASAATTTVTTDAIMFGSGI